MKTKLFLYQLLTILFFMTAGTIPNRSILKETSIDNGKITEIDLRSIPPEVFELKLSDLISDFHVIPLETKEECVIGNTSICFTKENILIGTQNFPGAAKLYRFNKTGQFLNEIGKSGRGPGEHIGYLTDIIHSFEENGTVLVGWGAPEKPQVFNTDGTFLYNITQPFGSFRYIDKWSDSIWFSPGAFAGPVLMPRDSVALVFYTNKGKVTDLIPRRTFPPKNANGYTPSPEAPSIYKYNGTWKLFMEGNDTIFNIINRKLSPSAIFIKDKKTLPFNSTISPDELIGKYNLRILAETNNNWIIDKSIIKKADIKEISPDRWGGQFTNEDQLLIIDKKSKKARYYKVKDDIFSFLPDEIFPVAIEWQDNNRIFISIQAIHLLKLFKDKQYAIKQNPRALKVIEQLKDLKEDSNPVIFTFFLKERIKIE